MQVNRMIRAGKLPAKRMGNRWYILNNGESLNQIGMEKTTSLQKWIKIIREELKKI